jgi:hypothetical protein
MLLVVGENLRGERPANDALLVAPCGTTIRRSLLVTRVRVEIERERLASSCVDEEFRMARPPNSEWNGKERAVTWSRLISSAKACVRSRVGFTWPEVMPSA